MTDRKPSEMGDPSLACVLSPERAPTMAAVYDCFAADLRLPDHFGRNLDALYDCLSGDVDQSFSVEIVQPGTMKECLGDSWHELAVLLLDVATERDDVTVSFTNR